MTQLARHERTCCSTPPGFGYADEATRAILGASRRSGRRAGRGGSRGGGHHRLPAILVRVGVSPADLAGPEPGGSVTRYVEAAGDSTVEPAGATAASGTVGAFEYSRRYSYE